ncbi:enoyl-CoA hydratase/isomerase family protein [Microbacterium sp. SORGH_AS_0888]|uniref:enoyl-CoA hydratase/isomerase family protein n=1 Tax=Microbacterium sp. SORGH_AS_0888 TaxID=3041791 RepID=UPI00278B9F7B|nr:enoyl-CoA hydratase/isomerase family protein [Microbacterium sp. SORGH_AS_0888]MDQ1131013.1 enoyl-CoA hydratase/carnithine racemase [Microbacterium sp. SORGH_AS_0888]
MTQVVTSVGDDGVARLALGGEETLNALDDGVVSDFGRALSAVLADPRVRVVVVEGGRRSFSVGGDLAMLAEMHHEVVGGAGEAVVSRLRANADVVHELLTASTPTIALVEGYCIGAGMAIAAACDIRIGSPRATFDTAYLSVGLGSDFGLGWLLSRLCGVSQATALLLSPGRISADHAHRIGLLTEVHDDARAQVAALAARIAGYPEAAVAAMKDNVRAASGQGFAEYADGEARRFVETLAAASSFGAPRT